MVYCNYKEHTDSTVTYLFGQTIKDITGELIFHFGEQEGIEIVKEPEKHQIIMRQAHSLYKKHREEFRKGIFKEKIAYEA